MELTLACAAAIETQRLHVRPLAMSDASDFRTMTADPIIIDAIHFLKSPFSLADAESLLRSTAEGLNCFWGVWLRGSPDLLGAVGAHLRGDREIEIGYWFSPAVHGHGYAAESVGAIVAWLEHRFPGRAIFAECRPENTASWRLLHRIGFHSLGTNGDRPGRKKLIYGP